MLLWRWPNLDEMTLPQGRLISPIYMNLIVLHFRLGSREIYVGEMDPELGGLEICIILSCTGCSLKIGVFSQFTATHPLHVEEQLILKRSECKVTLIG